MPLISLYGTSGVMKHNKGRSHTPHRIGDRPLTIGSGMLFVTDDAGTLDPVDIPGQVHTAISSSFTWCSRIKRGRSPVRKWQDTAS